MEKILDRINDAYYGGMGEVMMRKTHKRANWICKQVQGNKILDIGCSQGIVPILLGREGFEVTGIDISKKSIEYANEALKEEEIVTQKNIDFINENFMMMDFEDKKFDTIILSEVIEHLNQPQRFLKRAWEVLEDNGQIIITVPFGINDFIDHKKTYYLLDLLKEVTPYFKVEKVDILEKWIGVIGVKKEKVESNAEINISLTMIKDIENAFYDIERQLIDSNKNIQNSINTVNKKYREVTDQNMNLKKQVKLLKEVEEEKEKASKEKEKLLKEIESLSKENNRKNNELKEAIEAVLSHISDKEKYLKEIEYLLNINKMLINKNNKLEKTKTGKLFLKYWKIKDRISKRLKK
ncbi:class I SAM-dependent methyltransferase [Tepidibacter mesophilus]|uniref:class I SAM-dependent methyltransferase n=1 Tax=Tepidibacter mesophilus TaxID=655607 RepID=UPI000C06B9C8|nr:class I SAM-dependent methyltransferase [Tepidibacter mesophilus]